MRLRGTVFVLGTFATLAACDPAGRPAPDPEPSPDSASAVDRTAGLRVDREVYTLRPDGAMERASIAFTYVNARPDTLYHPTCRPSGGKPTVQVAVQKRIDGSWRPAWSQALPQCLSVPIVIPPGGTFADTLDLVLHLQDTLHHPLLTPRADLDGEFRLVWHELLSSYDAAARPFGEEIPLDARVSGAFRLRR